MSNKIVHQAVREWVSAYEQAHLKGLEREVLEKEQAWCDWLKEKKPRLIDEFTQEARFPASAPTIKEQWERWIRDKMLNLVEEWIGDYNWRMKASESIREV